MPADLKQKLLEVKEKLPDQFVDLHLGPWIWRSWGVDIWVSQVPDVALSVTQEGF